MATFDAVFAGAGINSLAGAALLSKAGWNVCLLERTDELGGCIKTSSDLTVPGFTHEVLASWHPLFTGSAAYAELEGDAGLEAARAEAESRSPRLLETYTWEHVVQDQRAFFEGTVGEA